ncbi:aminotransferase class I/II-fold pyridoxal phosphate-dependent enzyme [Roseobacter litoralis]|uniref:DegT/DnrJ/EryC1/StrS aminotransferase family protein n=1 Tax=Roseobacter litoralis (strain ATCC 49566 / DSM 6996 / JCM 21268 / NBRC 15278 / OCh 149) TaxID=391595 RepID=F7ZJ68_ROSLO|nr:aminotransferase class I/II-fold pyridoxal phosphate-dependent enzyme [Roseobacter litoralis]AEI96313.1 DegT/DnrJ/EryC1/StrS aminotransferase family protein [Roseobacter litoralis Och 149]
MLPLCVPNISGNEGKYLAECVSSTFVSSVGPFVDRFEAETRHATGAAWAVATSAGTTALHAALHFLGVGPGDHVIIPSLSFIATANAVAHCHATPIIIDVDVARWGLDAGLLAELLGRNCHRDSEGALRYTPTGGQIKAIMPVYAMGLPADMDSIIEVARRYNVPTVSDAAAAIGATYKGRQLAQMGADLTALSFNGNKLITSGGGGALISAAEQGGREIKHLTSTARVGGAYDHDIVGFNYRMTNLQAAVGVAQLERLAEFLDAKARIAARYAQSFEDLTGTLNFPSVDDTCGSHWLSGVYLPQATREQMDHLRQTLVASGIEARSFWKPLHMQAPYLKCPRMVNGHAEMIWGNVQPLPCSTHLTCAEQTHVIEVVRSAIEKMS